MGEVDDFAAQINSPTMRQDKAIESCVTGCAVILAIFFAIGIIFFAWGLLKS